MMRKGFSIWIAVCLAFLLVSGPKIVTAEQELIVSAAASLTNAFAEVGKGFERIHPGAKIVCNFGASGALLQQIEQGAPVDVFASADQKTMDRAQERDLILPATRKDFATNELVLVTPKDVKFPISSLKDLTLKEVGKISLGNPESVPAGRYAKEALTDAVLWENLSHKFIYGNSVRQVLDYVYRGEVDAGFVFSTDAVIAGDKVKVAANVEEHEPILYPIAVIRGTQQAELARRFVEFLLSSDGQEVLSRHGFRKP